MTTVHIQLILLALSQSIPVNTLASPKIPRDSKTISDEFLQVKRPRRSAYDNDASSQLHKPELIAHHDKDFTHLDCTVTSRRQNSEVFINCPALGSNMATGPCYEGCKPTQPCGKLYSRTESCVPNEQTVFCQKTQSSNGSVIISLRIKRTDPRLTGMWSCSHGGLESAKFMVGLDPVDSTPKERKITAVSPKKLPAVDHTTEPLWTDDRMVTMDRPLAYMRKPEIIFAVVTILGVSLLINLIFCIRCLVMRLYIDAYQEGNKSSNCLGACLCIPKSRRKPYSVRMTPMLPRSSNWGSMNNQNSSYHGSNNLFYQSPNLARIPLLVNQPSVNEFNGLSFGPNGSLSGTLKRQTQAGMPHMNATSSVGQLDAMFNQPFTYPQTHEGNIVFSQQAGDFGSLSNYIPSYIRVPSVHVPSPSLSHQALPINGLTEPTMATNGHAINLNSLYAMNVQPTIMGRQVIYDDVAAGTSSITANYNRTPDGSVIENSPALSRNAQLQQIAHQNKMGFQETGQFFIPENARLNGSQPVTGTQSDAKSNVMQTFGEEKSPKVGKINIFTGANSSQSTRADAHSAKSTTVNGAMK